MFRTLSFRGQPKNFKENISPYNQYASFKNSTTTSMTKVLVPVKPVDLSKYQIKFSDLKKPDFKKNSLFSQFKSLRDFFPFNIFPHHQDNPMDFFNPHKNFFSFNNKQGYRPQELQTKHPLFQEVAEFKKEVLGLLQTTEKSNDQIEKLLKKIEHELEKQTNMNDETSHAQVKLLETLIRDLYSLTREIIVSRGTSTHDIQKLETINKEEMEKLIQKMDESANSRLATFAAYATILSLIVAIIIFAYQEQQSQEKQKEDRMASAEKLKMKNDQIQQKIEEIELEYTGLINKKGALLKNINTLKQKNTELQQLKKKRWFFTSDLDLAIITIEKEIDDKTMHLQLVNDEIRKLEVYVKKQRDLEDEQIAELAAEPQKVENDEPEPPFFSPTRMEP